MINTITEHLLLVSNKKTDRQITSAIAEVDRAQMAITRKLTPAQRFQQMVSMIDFAEGVAAYRLRLRQSHLSKAEALKIIRRRHVER